MSRWGASYSKFSWYKEHLVLSYFSALQKPPAYTLLREDLTSDVLLLLSRVKIYAAIQV